LAPFVVALNSLATLASSSLATQAWNCLATPAASGLYLGTFWVLVFYILIYLLKGIENNNLHLKYTFFDLFYFKANKYICARIHKLFLN